MPRKLKKILLKRRYQRDLARFQQKRIADPDNPRWHQKTGELLARLGDNEGAIEALDQAATLSMASGHKNKAHAICLVMLQIDPAA